MEGINGATDAGIGEETMPGDEDNADVNTRKNRAWEYCRYI